MAVFAFREGYDIGGMGLKDVAHVDKATAHTPDIEGKEGEGHGVPRRRGGGGGGRGRFRGGAQGGVARRRQRRLAASGGRFLRVCYLHLGYC